MDKRAAWYIIFGLLPLSVYSQDTSSVRRVQGLKSITFVSTPKYDRISSLPANQATRHYGFFCRQELQMDKRNIPVRLRLGSMEYCNWMESKPGYRDFPFRK